MEFDGTLSAVFLDFDRRLIEPLIRRLSRQHVLVEEVSWPEPGQSAPDIIFYGQVSDLDAIAHARARFPIAAIIAIGKLKLAGDSLTKLAHLSVRWLDEDTGLSQMAVSVVNAWSGCGMENRTENIGIPSSTVDSSVLHLAKSGDRRGNGKNVFLVRRLEAAVETGFYWLRNPRRLSVCLSCGAGCPLQAEKLACRQCYTGICRFRGHLLAEEIVDQFIYTVEDVPWRNGCGLNLSMMGSGDCLLNIGETVRAWRILKKRYWSRSLPISFSTVGFLEPLRQLAEADLSNLDFSTIQLTVPYADDERRQRLLPAAVGQDSLESVAPELFAFAKKQGRPIVYNVFSIDGPEEYCNNRPEDAMKMAEFCRRIDPGLQHTVVKITELNGDGKGLPIRLQSGLSKSKKQFIRILKDAGISVRIGPSLGGTKAAGCGQLMCHHISPVQPANPLSLL